MALRFQLWPLDKKLRVIRTAKEYLRRHESELQEKYAQSRTFGSYVQQAQLFIIRLLQVEKGFQCNCSSNTFDCSFFGEASKIDC